MIRQIDSIIDNRKTWTNCTRSIVCCPLSVVRSQLSIVRCLLSVVYRLSMSRVALTVVCCLLSVVLSSQSAYAQRRKKQPVDLFWGATTGITHSMSENTLATDLLGAEWPNLNLSLGAFWTHSFGMRLNFGFNPQVGRPYKILYEEWPDRYHKYRYNILSGYLDFMFDISNGFTMYDKRPVFNMYFLVGGGYVHTFGFSKRVEGYPPYYIVDPTPGNYGAGRIGVLATYKLSYHWDFDAEILFHGTSDKVNGVNRGGALDTYTSISVGFVYHFKGNDMYNRKRYAGTFNKKNYPKKYRDRDVHLEEQEKYLKEYQKKHKDTRLKERQDYLEDYLETSPDLEHLYEREDYWLEYFATHPEVDQRAKERIEYWKNYRKAHPKDARAQQREAYWKKFYKEQKQQKKLEKKLKARGLDNLVQHKKINLAKETYRPGQAMYTTLSFYTDRSFINNNEQVAQLNHVARFLKDNPQATLVITGYPDRASAQNMAQNEALAKARAQAVYDELVRVYRVDANRLKVAWKADRTIQQDGTSEDWFKAVMFTME